MAASGYGNVDVRAVHARAYLGADNLLIYRSVRCWLIRRLYAKRLSHYIKYISAAATEPIQFSIPLYQQR